MRCRIVLVLLLCLGVSAHAELPRRVLMVRGLWADFYQFDTAFATLGGVRSINVWHSPDGVSGTFPGTAEDMARYDLVILANVNGRSLRPAGRALLKEYVAQGGAVLMLGGYYAFGAECHGTELEEIAPVEFLAGHDLVASPAGTRIAPVTGAAQPRVFWRHTVQPKPGARVVLTADEQPLLVTGPFGKGRVAVFAGSVMGEPGAGQLPFWEWPQWPAVLAETLTWLAPAGHAPVAKAAVLAQLRAATTSTNAVDQLFEAAVPVADPDFAPAAKALIEAGRPAQLMLGLRILGLSQAGGAKAELLAAFETGGVVPKKSSVDDLLDDAVSRTTTLVEPVLNPALAKASTEQFKAVQLAAVEGLGWLGDPAAVGMLREIVRKCPARVLAPGEINDTFTDADERRETALVAALRCGDASAAVPVVDAGMQNLYTLAAMKIKDAGAKTKKADTAAQINRLTGMQEKLVAGLQRLPGAVLPAMAQRVAAEDDRWVVPLAFAAFGRAFNDGRALQPIVGTALRQARLPAVATLAMP